MKKVVFLLLSLVVLGCSENNTERGKLSEETQNRKRIREIFKSVGVSEEELTPVDVEKIKDNALVFETIEDFEKFMKEVKIEIEKETAENKNNF